MLRTGFLFVILFTCMTVSPGAADVTTTNRVIVVGGDRDYPPYEFLDGEGNPAGYNVELTKAIAEVMGMKAEFRLGAWDEAKTALKRGDIDLLQGISYSEERTKSFDFSPPHTIVYHSIFARKGSPAVTSLHDLEGRELALHKGGVMHEHILEKGYRITLITTETPADALRLLAAGKHDYAAVAIVPGTYLIKELHLTNLEPVARGIMSVQYGYAVKKGNAALLARINEGLAIVKKTGRYQEIHNRWLGVLEPHGVPWSSIVRYGLIIVLPLLLILAGTVVWSRTLRRQVALRTAALAQEMEEHKRTAEELRLRQQQLVQADKMASLGILVSGVAHEINNPNGLILMNMPLLMETFKDSEPIFDEYREKHGDFELGGMSYAKMKERMPLMLQDMQEGSKRIKRIVEDLKDFAKRDDSGHMDILDLNRVAQAAVRLVDNSLRKATCRFETRYAAQLPGVSGNSQRIEQVIVNLILNSCQALTDSEKSISLSTSFDEEKGMVRLEVRDEGRGIEPEHLQHLTDPFFTTKREEGGTGLGLSVSDGIVKEHGGTLHFDSEVGKGTVAVLELPVAARSGEVS